MLSFLLHSASVSSAAAAGFVCSPTLSLHQSSSHPTRSLEWSSTETSLKSTPADENEDIQGISDLKSSLSGMFRVNSRKPTPMYGGDPSMGLSPSDLEAYFAQRQIEIDATATSISNSSHSPHISKNSTSSDDIEGVYLEPDVYVQSQKWMQPDGALRGVVDDRTWQSVDRRYKQVARTLVQQAPYSPDTTWNSGNADGNDNISLDDLWAAVQNQNTVDASSTLSEDMHRKVFEAEQGFLDQSETFRQALVDSSKASEAAALRHGAKFQERQKEAIDRLNAQIADFEAELKVTTPAHPSSLDTTAQPRCRKCFCRLGEEEVRSATTSNGFCQVCHADDIVERSRQETAQASADQRRLATQKRREEKGRKMPSSHRGYDKQTSDLREDGVSRPFPQTTLGRSAPNSHAQPTRTKWPRRDSLPGYNAHERRGLPPGTRSLSSATPIPKSPSPVASTLAEKKPVSSGQSLPKRSTLEEN